MIIFIHDNREVRSTENSSNSLVLFMHEKEYFKCINPRREVPSIARRTPMHSQRRHHCHFAEILERLHKAVKHLVALRVVCDL